MAYEFLAQVYDRLTQDVSYETIFGFYHKIMARYGKRPSTVLDLACGTGSMALRLAQAGYQVTGVDAAEEMLIQAAEKTMQMEKNRPVFACQRMEKLSLPMPVDMAICCLDSLNYVVDPLLCQETIARVYQALTPGGLFVFDINSPAKLESMDGQMFLDEDDDVYCLWRGEYDGPARLCRYGMDIFIRRGRLWQRQTEEHLEYAYTVEQLTEYIQAAGFANIQTFGDCVLEKPDPMAQRIFFAAEKGEGK